MITIVDYGMGNLRSVQKAFESLGYSAVIATTPQDVARAGHLVLPGVGAFRDCLESLQQQQLVAPLTEHIAADRPFLGICLGMQVLFDLSSEFGSAAGLGVVPGTVERFPQQDAGGEPLIIPHMGWNSLDFKESCPLFAGVPQGSYVYFVHSYYVRPRQAEDVAATAHYGTDFCAAIWRHNLFATQFHPEKSQRVGLRMLQNFAEMEPCS